MPQPLIHDEETMRDWLMFILGSNYEAPDGGELFIGGESKRQRQDRHPRPP